MKGGILVFAESEYGSNISKSLQEITGLGQSFASELQEELICAIIGKSPEKLAAEIGGFGFDKIILNENKELSRLETWSYASILFEIISQYEPHIIIMALNDLNRDIAPRLAAKLLCPLALDCIEAFPENHNVIVKRTVFGAKILVEEELNGKNILILPRPNSFPPAKPVEKSPEILKTDFSPTSYGEEIIEIKEISSDSKDITEAEIIVAGGRGVEGGDFSLLENLAETLDCAVGASRAAVDEGFRPHSEQIGQTGKVVSPSLYIACGISGALQHLAGMNSSKCVVAINNDASAPICEKADYIINGDLFEILPALDAEFKNLKG